MAELTTIARPYAKAAFDVAVEKNTVDNWAEMLDFIAVVSAHPQVQPMLKGAVAPQQVAEFFIGICGEQINSHGQNLVKVMAENGRLEVLPAVSELFIQYRNEWAKEVEAEVISATELSSEQLEQISASVEKRLSRKVKLNCSTDASLVAGVIIKAGDLVIDGSVSGQLSRLNDELKS
ncbi:F0F1 ATP synthase subunit delta [Parashewanella spongiae]|uniref:ATP synthase subunit delta n=1 Tax=Parashewanella spongiae TaxID=342950 RepID=A0A3A6TWN8_9GAMM|nr:F0F1 ATP synthase subunit delta [Parashewanella spongiae]MCL1078043.1 F0F1 ATP synthase subunit delta [Parashewanella spongiae]RJY17438.1 F0F1 ATP synthase subunit delta [Parashewanella spongiae]